MRDADPAKPLVRWRWLWLLGTVVALYVLLPQLGVFNLSWHAVHQARTYDLWLAGLFTACTYPAAAASYVLLSLRPLSYGRTVLMQLASMFANRLLPAGVGGISVNYAYLRTARHTPIQAASLVAVNNTLGFVGHILVVGVAVAVWHSQLSDLRWPYYISLGWAEGLLVTGVVVIAIVARRVGWRLVRGAQQVLEQMLAYRRHRLGHLSVALLTLVCLTLCNVLSLYWSARALDVPIAFANVLLVFTLGIGIGTITPTPGGLGGVEAGLVAGLIANHVPDSTALTTVLIYRFISYWLPLAGGAVAFVLAERRKYF